MISCKNIFVQSQDVPCFMPTALALPDCGSAMSLKNKGNWDLHLWGNFSPSLIGCIFWENAESIGSHVHPVTNSPNTTWDINLVWKCDSFQKSSSWEPDTALHTRYFNLQYYSLILIHLPFPFHKFALVSSSSYKNVGDHKNCEI